MRESSPSLREGARGRAQITRKRIQSIRTSVRQARRFRRERTPAEQLVWRHLRRRRCDGQKFRFQHPVPPYIVDFVCLARRLIIEVDGGQHACNRDAARTSYLEGRGFRVLRFYNDVLENLDGVYVRIEEVLCRIKPSP